MKHIKIFAMFLVASFTLFTANSSSAVVETACRLGAYGGWTLTWATDTTWEVGDVIAWDFITVISTFSRMDPPRVVSASGEVDTSEAYPVMAANHILGLHQTGEEWKAQGQTLLRTGTTYGSGTPCGPTQWEELQQ